MTTSDVRTDPKLIAHFLRRAGFGGTFDEINYFSRMSYEQAVDKVLDAVDSTSLPIDLIRRYHVDQSDVRTANSSGAFWMNRMVTTDAPLSEKVALLWHRVFATAQTKLIQGKVMTTQIDMFRKFGLGSFDQLLLQLSRDPAMIMWLDNQDNHKSSINENYGREILELFSLGVGNYTEDDIKECSRAFTGWTVANTDYMTIKMRNNTMRPYGYVAWQFKYDERDHDAGEKTFLGQTGNFNGEDVIDIICQQQATARFVARHMYHFFVADEFPVPQWPHFPPKDPQVIQLMADAYFDSGHNIKAMLRALFLSDQFRAKASHNARIKCPVELVVGTLRLAGGYDERSDDVYNAVAACNYMGQALMAPPSVEGWMGGEDWISTGSMMQRVNYTGGVIGDLKRPGVKRLVDAIKSDSGRGSNAETLVESSLRQLGYLEVSNVTIEDLIEYASGQSGDCTDEEVASLLQLIVATREYQMA